MLNFDTTHKSVDGDVKKINGSQTIKRLVATGLIITQLFTFSACAKTIPCDIEGDHAHLYTTEQGIERYVVSEKSEVHGMERQDKYVFVTEDEEALLKYMNKNDLFKIEGNEEAIQSIEDNNHDYTEYRYRYIYMQPVPIVHSNGKSTYVTYNYIPVPKYSWTTDTTRNLTGETRDCHYMYYGYKVTQNENGKYVMEQSDLVESISDLGPEYEYVSKKFSTIVNRDTKQTLDYEDGIENDQGDNIDLSQYDVEFDEDGSGKTI